MTLLQTVFSWDRIIQVSDRRLTLNGEVFSHECWPSLSMQTMPS